MFLRFISGSLPGLSDLYRASMAATNRRAAPASGALGIVCSAAALVLSMGYVLAVLTGTRSSSVLALGHTSNWAYCNAILGLVPDPAYAAEIWARSLRGRDNVRREALDFDAMGAEKRKCRCRSPPVYSAGEQPRMTAIIQSFNHVGNVRNISSSLKASSVVEEIVICEDGSTDGSIHEWKQNLPGQQHFIIRSNNLHELRSYNRAMRMSGGDVVCLMQDDDLLPLSDEWLQNAMKLFESKPELGLLGGYIGQLWDPQTGKGYEYGEQRSTHGGLRQGNTDKIQYVDESTGVPFMYAECVWIAPVFVRRSLLEKAGGLDLSIAKRGEPGVWQDCVFSYEAWVNGYTVGVFGAEFGRGVGGHGSATSPEKIKQRERVWERAVAYTNRHYNRPKIHDYVVKLNNETLLKRHGV